MIASPEAHGGSWPARTALVTGASSGIGRALAMELAQRGAHVTLLARRERALVEVAREVEAAGGRATVAVADVADTPRLVERMRALDDDAGGIDVVFANAGVGAPSNDPQLSWEAIEPALATNLLGGAATLTALLPRMIERGRGHLVAISSIASFGALPGAAVYCAPKAGLSMLTECLRMDLLGKGVAATSVHVGFVRTAMVERTTFAMPMLMEADAAARHIVERLPDAPATIDFPAPIALAAKALAALPVSVRDAIARRVKSG